MSDFDRIFGPRLEKAVKAISLLETGVRYNPTPEQISKTIEELDEAVMAIRSAYGVPASDGPKNPPTEAKAPDGWRHDDIRLNVTNIPANQLSFYATQIVARMGEIVDTGKDGW